MLVKEAGSTLVTIAKDVKIQVEFNPKAVNALSADRLREPHAAPTRTSTTTRKDAGEIGAGHSVTAIYEIVPAGVEVARPNVDPLNTRRATRPRRPGRRRPTLRSNELVTVKLRYKAPDGDTSRLISTVILNRTRR